MTRRPPSTRAELDHQRCEMPGCAETHDAGEPIFLHGRCHMGAGNEVEYRAGVLTVRCRICKMLVSEILVHSGGPSSEYSTPAHDIEQGSALVVDEIGVAEWSPGKVDENVPPTQVHITLNIPDLPVQFSIRLKSRERAEWLCATIMKHAEGVWPGRA